MDPEFSFPNNVTIHLTPPMPGQQKSRAKSMSGEPPVQRRPQHAHRRSAAVSEDLRNMKFSITPNLKASPPEISSGVPEDRKVAFIDPPTLIPQLSPTSANSTVSPYSPRKPSPRRRTMSSMLVPEEPSCIDLDEALYSKTLHRRTESLPTGLRSPFLQGPRIIETLAEEDEHREREEEREKQEQIRKEALAPKTPSTEPRLSSETGSSMGSESTSGNSKEKKKRFSFLLHASSPRKSRNQSPQRLRDRPSVSNLGIPIPDAVQRDLGLSASAPAGAHISSGFALGEPGPLNPLQPPSPERRNRRSFITSWVYRHKELKYL